jgi:uncharacterized protein (TIGR03663 family)
VTSRSASRWCEGSLFLVAILLAAALRLPGLAARPMHADEAVHADKFGTLLEGGAYAYDPSEYHGPTLYYLTLLPAWVRGTSRYVEIDEVTLRCVPAVLGVALVAAHLGARALLGFPGAALAALLAALSPAMVFYGRYYIHETPLVFFSFCALLAAWRYLRQPAAGWAVLAGASAGLMLATKETAPLALGSMVLALGLTDLTDRWRRDGALPLHRLVQGRHLLLALAAAVVVSAAFFTSFLAHPRGIVDALRAYGYYLGRAGAASWHVHPWDYYLRLLLYFPARGTPVWTEGLVVLLAVAGGVAGWRTGPVTPGAGPAVEPRALRFLAFYTLLLLLVYSAVPYKTPWCLLGFLHGMELLAGAGAVFLVRSLRGRAARALVCGLLGLAIAQLGWQAYCGAFRFAADPRNPWVYAQTGTDVFRVVERVEGLARAHPDGRSMPIQVISRQNLWPLPWYLRRFTRVSWWNGVSDEAKCAPVILATPDMEPALLRRLYELPPPGERELYVSIFERPVELRPQVELRGYAASSLWEDFRRLGARP